MKVNLFLTQPKKILTLFNEGKFNEKNNHKL